MKTRPTLSVVIIARNEEKTIRNCIKAAFEALEVARGAGLAIPSGIVLADSCSSDRTVEIASEFPITIVGLPATWSLSASAGRYTGGRFATGDLVLYLDGDYVVRAQWLEQALRILANPRITGVMGTDIERFPGNSVLESRLWKWTRDSAPKELTEEVEAIAVGVLRRSAVQAAGDFQPFLRGAEDRDLGYRLTAMGHRLIRTREPMGEHYWADSVTRFSYMTYFKSAAFWSYGEGQALRIRFSDASMRRKYVGRYGTVRYLLNLELGAFLIIVGVLNAAAILIPALFLIPAAAADVVAIASCETTKFKRCISTRELVFEFFVVPYVVVRLGAFVLGFLRGAADPRNYPTNPVLIKASPALSQAEHATEHS